MSDLGETLEELTSTGYEGSSAPIRSFMSDDVRTIDSGASIREAATLLDEASIGCIVVGSIETVDGVLSERDVVRAVALGLDLDVATVSDLESTTLEWCSVDATVGDVTDEMLQDYVRHVLVTGHDGRLAGIVSMRDVLSAYLE